jgi:pimeloyl-ACP methyl ester carboxylesterase
VTSTFIQMARGVLASAGLAALAACSSFDRAPALQSPLACDMSGLGQLQIDSQTRVLAVRSFKAGEDVRLTNSPAPHVKTAVDVCMVKLLVGPGNAGPAGAPSTSVGIGIEVWLPARDQWNQTIRAYGSGGWAGGFYADPTRLGQSGGGNAMFLGAVQKGYAVSGTDHGHGGTVSGRNASFAMNPDGSPNTVLWRDFSERSLLEQALKTKAVVKAYYGKAHGKAYFDGYSTGGRQGYKLAQKYPEQYDGILAGAPAFNWTRFITAELFPQVVMQRDLGQTIPNSKLHAASASALRACGGAQASWGFLLDPLACSYNPARDPAALCAGEMGETGVQGANTLATCLSAKEAQALNKIWFGLTRDGRAAPDPAQDNGRTGVLSVQQGQLWWGLTRGTDLTALAGDRAPFPIASQVTALSLQNPRIAQKGMFSNAMGDGEDGWKALSYAHLANAFERGLALQPSFSDINTDSADLTAFRQRGAKLLSYHGLSDQLIMPQGSLNYFDRLSQRMGGAEQVQSFNRLFFIPGFGHTGAFNLTSAVGLNGTVTPPSAVPLPQPATGRDELFNALRAWVEKGVTPERIELTAAAGNLSLPICAHPKKPALTGAAVNAAASYVCR